MARAKRIAWSLVLVLLGALVACGGGSSTSSDSVMPADGVGEAGAEVDVGQPDTKPVDVPPTPDEGKEEVTGDLDVPPEEAAEDPGPGEMAETDPGEEDVGPPPCDPKDCPAGEGCLPDGTCGPCTAAEQCREGEACREPGEFGTCGSCRVADECAEGLGCVPGEEGEPNACAPCTEGAQCAGMLCVIAEGEEAGGCAPCVPGGADDALCVEQFGEGAGAGALG